MHLVCWLCCKLYESTNNSRSKQASNPNELQSRCVVASAKQFILVSFRSVMWVTVCVCVHVYKSLAGLLGCCTSKTMFWHQLVSLECIVGVRPTFFLSWFFSYLQSTQFALCRFRYGSKISREIDDAVNTLPSPQLTAKKEQYTTKKASKQNWRKNENQRRRMKHTANWSEFVSVCVCVFELT